MIAYWTALLDRFPIVSIEDGCAEDDWDGWAALIARARRPRAARRRRPVRDEHRAARARDPRVGAANAILIKVNQIGTLTETARRDRAGAALRVRRRDQPPQRRDRGHDDRRPRGRDERGPDQDRRAEPRRAHGEVQPAPADRGGARRDGPLRGRRPPVGPTTRWWRGAMSARATATSPAAAPGEKHRPKGARLTPRASILAFVVFVAAIFAVAPARAFLEQRSQQDRLAQQVSELQRENDALQQRLDDLQRPGASRAPGAGVPGVGRPRRDRVRPDPARDGADPAVLRLARA